MRWQARKMASLGLGAGLVLAGMGAAALWKQESPDTSRAFPTPVVSRAAEPTQRPIEESEALRAEVARLKAAREEVKQLAQGMRSELTTLRSRLIQVEREQAWLGQEPTTTASADHIEDKTADAPTFTAEEEHERAEAQIRAQMEMFEDTIRVEQADPGWASAAQLALSEAFHRQAIAGLRLMQADCRTSLCRLELVLDGSLSPEETFYQLMHDASWPGQSFVRIDEESAEVIVYLSREGYALPEVRQ